MEDEFRWKEEKRGEKRKDRKEGYWSNVGEELGEKERRWKRE